MSIDTWHTSGQVVEYIATQTRFGRVKTPEGMWTNHQNKILALGGVGGRRDQEFANYNVMFTYPHLPMVCITDHCLVTVLPPGRHTIIPDASVEGPVCGLIPLGGAARVTTSGLKWNLDNDEMRFGGLVSTSNEIVAAEVMVETDGALIWTTETSAHPTRSWLRR